MVSNKQELIVALYEIGAVQRGDFTLKSGQKSEWYIDLRQVFAKPTILQCFAEEMVSLVEPDQIDLVCGVPYGGLPLATLVSSILNKPLLMIRKQVKNHGKQRLFEGLWEEGDRCLIIEDVITTGTSVSEVVNQLVAHGMRVCDVVTGVDRAQGAGERLGPWGIKFKSVLTIDEIINQLN